MTLLYIALAEVCGFLVTISLFDNHNIATCSDYAANL